MAVSIALRCGDETWADVVSGNRAEPTGVSVHADSCFLIQSLTKSFTAVVILRLIASGYLVLDAPLSRWLPDVPNASCVTIRQCLQHTSGFPDYGPLPEYRDAVRLGARPWTFVEFLERTHAEKLLFEPGSGWRYSNIGYMILRRLIENVRSQNFADAITAEVCTPLGLKSTFVITDRSDLQHLTAGYSTSLASGGQPVDARDVYDPGWIVTGVMASTAFDVVHFYHQLFAGELLASALLQEMCSVVRAIPSHPRFVTPSYGLGLMADPDSPYGEMYGHNGEGPGYSASAFHFKSSRREPLTVAVLSNTENPEETEMMALAAAKALAQE